MGDRHDFTDEQAAAVCAALSGDTIDAWLPAVRAWRHAGWRVEDVVHELLLGGTADPALVERIARESFAYAAADVQAAVLELRTEVLRPWRERRSRLADLLGRWRRR